MSIGVRVPRMPTGALLLALLQGCGGGADGGMTGPPPVTPMPPTPPTTPAPVPEGGRIGAAGGTINVTLPDGGNAQLVIPAQSLYADTTIRLTALAPDSGQQARIRVEPAGLVLRQPATMTITLTADPGPDAALGLTGSSAPLTLATTQNGRTLTATTRLFGYDPAADGTLPRGSGLRARAALMTSEGSHSSTEVIVTSVDIARRVQQFSRLLQLTDSVPPTLITAIGLNMAAAALVQSGPQASQFVENLSVLVCEQFFNVQRDLNSTPMDRVGAFAPRVKRVIVWSAALQQIDRDGRCPQGSTDPRPTLDSKAAEYFAFLNGRPQLSVVLADFASLFASELQEYANFAGALQQLDIGGAALQAASLEVFAPLYEQVRDDAYRLCEAPPGGQHRFLARVQRFVGDLQLAGTNASLEEVRQRINYCATAIDIELIREDASVADQSAKLGRRDADPSAPFVLSSLNARWGDSLRISGDMRAFQCVDSNYVQTRLENDVLALSVNGSEVRVQPQGPSGRLIPAGGFTVPIDSLTAANGTIEGDPARFRVIFARKGGGCARLYSSEDTTTIGVISMNVDPTLVINDSILPAATAGTAYQHQLTSSDQTNPVQWQLSLGDLPAGLTLSAQGVITGTPTTAGTASFRVRATSPQGTRSKVIQLTVDAAPFAITTTALRPGAVGAVYRDTLRASGIVPGPVTWSFVGQPPCCLGIGASSGIIDGGPVNGGSYPIRFRLVNGGRTTERTLTLDVEGPQILTTSFRRGTRGVAYRDTVRVASTSGGPLDFTNSALPVGLFMSRATGEVSGTPAEFGAFNISVIVFDGPREFRAQIPMIIDSGAALPPTPPPVGELGIFVPSSPFTIGLGIISGRITPTQLQAQNATPGVPLVWSVVSGSFGGNITLSPTGLLSGSRAQEGAATVTIRVVNGTRSATRTITFDFVLVLDGGV